MNNNGRQADDNGSLNGGWGMRQWTRGRSALWNEGWGLRRQLEKGVCSGTWTWRDSNGVLPLRKYHTALDTRLAGERARQQREKVDLTKCGLAPPPASQSQPQILTSCLREFFSNVTLDNLPAINRPHHNTRQDAARSVPGPSLTVSTTPNRVSSACADNRTTVATATIPN